MYISYYSDIAYRCKLVGQLCDLYLDSKHESNNAVIYIRSGEIYLFCWNRRGTILKSWCWVHIAKDCVRKISNRDPNSLNTSFSDDLISMRNILYHSFCEDD